MASVGQAPIKRAELVRQVVNMNTMRPPVGDAANAFKANDLVKLSSGALVALATDDVLLWGQVLDKSKASTDVPPDSFFGENHYALDPHGAEFEINIGHVGSTTDVTIGTSAKNPGDVTIGTSYGIWVPTTGTYAGIPFLDSTETTNTLFTVVGKVDGVLDSDANGRVRVAPIASKIQA